MLSITQISKPSNAGWRAKITAEPTGEVEAAPAPDGEAAHDFHKVEVAWYGHARVKVTLRDGGPAMLRQAYLSGAGQDVILDLVRAPAAQ
jgi:hypothetical protein